jgi:undecaprenyl-diphosphatase
MLNDLLNWDKNIFIYLNNLGSEKFDFFWVNVTDITSWIPLTISLVVLVFFTFPKKEAWIIIASFVFLLLITLGITHLTKEFFVRPRPNNDLAINPLIRVLKNAQGFSFFSGHASSSFAMTSLAILVFKRSYKWVWILLLWPLIFAYSRIYVGVHYPLDIICGAAVGTILAYLIYQLYKRFSELYKE